MPQEQTQAKKHAALYIDRAGEAAIVVTLHYNGPGGFLYEDETPTVTQPNAPDSLGSAVQRALDASDIRPPTSHRDKKLTEWPAFKSSGRRSVRQFEADFIRLHISGANESNIIYQIEGWPEKDADLRVVASASSAPVGQLGERCLIVWRACRDRSV